MLKLLLMECSKENSDKYHQGYTANYTQVKVPRKSKEITLRKQIFNVKITSVEKDFCFGEIVEEEYE